MQCKSILMITGSKFLTSPANRLMVTPGSWGVAPGSPALWELNTSWGTPGLAHSLSLTDPIWPTWSVAMEEGPVDYTLLRRVHIQEIQTYEQFDTRPEVGLASPEKSPFLPANWLLPSMGMTVALWMSSEDHDAHHLGANFWVATSV